MIVQTNENDQCSVRYPDKLLQLEKIEESKFLVFSI